MFHSRSAALTALASVLLAGGAMRAADGEKAEPSPKPADPPAMTQAMKDGVDAMKKRDWKRAAAAGCAAPARMRKITKCWNRR